MTADRPLRVALLGASADALAVTLAPLFGSRVRLQAHVSPDDPGTLALLLAPGPGADPDAMAADEALRATLTRAGTAYGVLHGDRARQHRQARMAIERRLNPPPPGGEPPWRCAECSDPDCEHRLFRRLLSGNA